ncbi:MAG: hypothetical protein LQ352_005717 [Teloschistes flavicans]|nr:MAG: hypothetical protein LQ352_005717 [Teloschistes flavicans]
MGSMDQETANLILALQRHDLEQVKMTSKGKGRETDLFSDADLAIQLQQQEFEQAGHQIADRRMAESIHRAVLDDGASVLILASEENQAMNDHNLAYKLATPIEKAACDRNLAVQLNHRRLQSTPQLSSLILDDDNISWYSAVNNRDGTVDDGDPRLDVSEDYYQAESSAWAASRTSGNHRGHCVSCQEMKEIVEHGKLAGNGVSNVNIWLNWALGATTLHVDVATSSAISVVRSGNAACALYLTSVDFFSEQST